MPTINSGKTRSANLSLRVTVQSAHPAGSKLHPNPSPKWGSGHYQHFLESPLHRAYRPTLSINNNLLLTLGNEGSGFRDLQF
jgi:hypothetical protein